MALSLSRQPEPGTIVDGRYRLESLVGEGGHATVWRGIQLSTSQPVAVKMLTASVGQAPSPRRGARFERETRLIGQLRHPSIVRLIDSGKRADGTLWTVLELVDGKPLRAVLDEDGPLEVDAAVDVMTRVLEAVEHAHKRGVIHRDLKPANIMLGGSDRRIVKVLDFGIAGIMVDARDQDYKSITRSKDFFGTPAYMAPEQLRRASALTPPIDIYAWGLVFVECLTGHPLVDGESLMDIAMAHIDPAPHVLPDVVPPILEPILRRALVKNPDERFQTAAEILDELDVIASSIRAESAVERVATSYGAETHKMTPMHLDAAFDTQDPQDSEAGDELATTPMSTADIIQALTDRGDQGHMLEPTAREISPEMIASLDDDDAFAATEALAAVPRRPVTPPDPSAPAQSGPPRWIWLVIGLAAAAATVALALALG